MSQICHTVCTSATAIQHRLYMEYPVRSTPCVYTTTEYSTVVLRLCASWITIRNALWLILKQLPYCPVLSPVGSDCTERPNRHIRVQAFFYSGRNGIQSNKRVRVCTVCMPAIWMTWFVRPPGMFIECGVHTPCRIYIGSRRLTTQYTIGVYSVWFIVYRNTCS